MNTKEVRSGVDGLKRYEVFPYLDDEVAELDICESYDGTFVKYDDAQAIIDELRAELAALKAQGVVIPERWNVPRPMWKDARQPYGNPLNHADIEAAEKFNLALDEVARLNAAMSAGKEG